MKASLAERKETILALSQKGSTLELKCQEMKGRIVRDRMQHLNHYAN